MIDGRIVVIAAGILLWPAHKPFSVNIIVVTPVGNRGHGNGCFEIFGAFGKAERRKVTAVTPSEYAYPVRVNVFFRCQEFCRFDLVDGFILAQLKVGHLLEFLSACPCSPVINRYNYITILGQHLEPYEVKIVPTVGHCL